VVDTQEGCSGNCATAGRTVDRSPSLHCKVLEKYESIPSVCFIKLYLPKHMAPTFFQDINLTEFYSVHVGHNTTRSSAYFPPPFRISLMKTFQSCLFLPTSTAQKLVKTEHITTVINRKNNLSPFT
jgi:hypothetical protein